MLQTDSGKVARQAAPTEWSRCEQRRSVAGAIRSSAAWVEVLALAEAVAVTDATVLIQGETGSGKELMARALHDASERAAGPFVQINCAAIPVELIERELMGQERAAFAGADMSRMGRFELAHSGTIFLDEVGELPMSVQPKLLRLLQEREFERVGGTHTVRANVRVVAATNRDLRAMVKERAFQEELYHCLHVFPLQLPPLCERREEVPQLAQHFVERTAERLAKPIAALSARSLEKPMS